MQPFWHKTQQRKYRERRERFRAAPFGRFKFKALPGIRQVIHRDDLFFASAGFGGRFFA